MSLGCLLLQTLILPLHANNKINIQQSFVPMVIGQPSIQIDYQISKTTSAGILLEYSYALVGKVGPGFSTGFNFSYMLNARNIMNNDGLYIESHIYYHKNNFLRMGHNDAFAQIGSSLGYQLMWNNGFNIKTAFGVGINSIHVGVFIQGYIVPTAKITIGFAFE